MNRSWRTVGTARTGALALGALGAAFGLLTLAEASSAPAGSFGGTSWVGALAELAAGWALIAAGAAESWRKPASREGLLLAGAGTGWFFTDWNNPGLGSPAAFTIGLVVSALAAPLVAHAALAYPAGRLGSRLDVCALVFADAGAGLVLGLLPAMFFDPGRQGCGLCQANLVLARSEPGLAGGLQRAGLLLALGWAAALVAAGIRRLVRASPPLRRMLWPVLAPAGCYLLLAGADLAHSLPRGTLGNEPVDYRLWLGEAACLVLTALGVSWAWVRDRRTRSAVVRLVMDAAQSPPPGGLRTFSPGSWVTPASSSPIPWDSHPAMCARTGSRPASGRAAVKHSRRWRAAGGPWRSCGTGLACWTTPAWSRMSRPLPGSAWKTSGSTPRCWPSSKTCRPHRPGSSRAETPNGGGWSRTCTTAPSNGSSGFPSRSDSPALSSARPLARDSSA